MADEIIRLDYSAEDIGANIDEVREARGTYDTLDDRLDNIEGGGPSPSNPIASNCVSPMTGYSKSSSSTPGNISTDDTLNAAIGKLEKRTELNENNILSVLDANGAKNLLNFNGSAPTVPTGVTMTDNGDGTYTLTKTVTTQEVPYIAAQLKAGMYILSGSPANGSDDTYSLDIRNASGQFVGGSDYGNGCSVTIPSDGWYRITCRLAASYTTTGIIIKPMLCDPALWAVSHTFEPYAMSNAELTAKEQQNESNILLKADKISFGFSGNPNPAVYVKDWDFVPDGTYLLTYICSQDASTRRGVSVYMFTKYTTNHIVLFTPVVEVSGAIITSCVASGSEGAETITFTIAQRGYHTAAAIQIQAF